MQGQLCHGLSTILNQGQRRWFLEFYQFLAQLGSSDSSSQRGGSSHQTTTTTNKSAGGAGSRSSDSPPSNTITGNQLTASPMPDLLPVQQTQSSESSSQVQLTHFCNQINVLCSIGCSPWDLLFSSLKSARITHVNPHNSVETPLIFLVEQRALH